MQQLISLFQLAGCIHRALKGIITLIPKKGRDSRYLRHLRPITLLNTCYKLIEKCLANRLKPLLQSLIHEDQKGFLANRRISSNIRCILDIMEYVNNTDTSVNDDYVILSLDYEKCFDRVEIPALLGALKYFNFRDKFINFTKTIYNGAKSCVTNNGYCSSFFEVTRSIKQGGPCSSYFFLLVAEILAIRLRSNERIQGINIGDFKKLFGQYADDMDIYCKNTKTNMYEINRELKSLLQTYRFQN